MLIIFPAPDVDMSFYFSKTFLGTFDLSCLQVVFEKHSQPLSWEGGSVSVALVMIVVVVVVVYRKCAFFHENTSSSNVSYPYANHFQKCLGFF